jgi:CubicO group peptidase (beta-lactamase class C family)
MRKLLILLLLTTSAFAQQRRVMIGGGRDENATRDWPKLQGSSVEAIGPYLDALVARDLFSGTVLVARAGKPLFFKSYGMANKEWNVPNTNDTKYNLGSINKMFTNIALRQLRDAGKLDFDKPLRTYLPDYPSSIADRITIKQLMEHKSGMGDIFGPEYDALPKNRLRTLADYLPLFVNKPLQFDPGTSQRYSNAGYIVLGLVIEKTSGESYYDYVREHIFKPAGMTSTGSYTPDEVVGRRATGYAEGKANVYTLPGRGSSAGGGYSTAEDLLRLTQWLKADGLGVGGGAPGINASLEVEGEWQLIVLSNYSPPAAQEVAANIRKLWSGGE